MKDKNTLINKEAAKKFLLPILFIVGILLIIVSQFSDTDRKKQSATYSNLYETDYANILEIKLKNVLESITGEDTVCVMITFENTYEMNEYDEVYAVSDFSLPTESKNESFTAVNKPTPKIGGVMIVCSSLSNPDDIKTIKKAAATALNIKENKIYIIGGASKQ